MGDACKEQALKELVEIRSHIIREMRNEKIEIQNKWKYVLNKFNEYLSSCPDQDAISTLYLG